MVLTGIRRGLHKLRARRALTPLIVGVGLLLWLLVPADMVMPSAVFNQLSPSLFLEKRPMRCVSSSLAEFFSKKTPPLGLRTFCAILRFRARNRIWLQRQISRYLGCLAPRMLTYGTCLTRFIRLKIDSWPHLANRVLAPAKYIADTFNPESQLDLEISLAVLHAIAALAAASCLIKGLCRSGASGLPRRVFEKLLIHDGETE
ncbi:MAG: hypothetical protein KVP17_002773 [Porospora cf. gigantea B]|uniref:uncharacterized protein n=2 Tax=Porospora cf. gigantea B TaxID=2853592 RepID=UPI003571E785|nr:MAG: hypothetical protein KVP17_002773 [Porospora cf. gigantea B]